MKPPATQPLPPLSEKGMWKILSAIIFLRKMWLLYICTNISLGCETSTHGWWVCLTFPIVISLKLEILNIFPSTTTWRLIQACWTVVWKNSKLYECRKRYLDLNNALVIIYWIWRGNEDFSKHSDPIWNPSQIWLKHKIQLLNFEGKKYWTISGWEIKR